MCALYFLYMSPVWSLLYLNKIASAQCYFYKNYFFFVTTLIFLEQETNIPRYILEKNWKPFNQMTVKIIKHTLSVINNIHLSDEDSILIRCSSRLVYLVLQPCKSINWISKVNFIFQKPWFRFQNNFFWPVQKIFYQLNQFFIFRITTASRSQSNFKQHTTH